MLISTYRMLLITLLITGFGIYLLLQSGLVTHARDKNLIQTGSASRIIRERQKITASDGGGFDDFGSSVAVSGNTAVIGAIADDGPQSNSGTAYIFVKEGKNWIEQEELIGSDTNSFSDFGISVAVAGDTVVVGASGSGNGDAFVFVKDGSVWSEQQKLTASDGANTDLFGFSVSISGDTIVVGAYGDDDDGNATGSAYVFTRTGSIWTEQQKLLASDRVALDRFGESVAIDGDTIIVSSRTAGINDRGAAYVYTRSGTVWTEQQKLISSDSKSGFEFGNKVDVSGDTAAVCKRTDNDNGFFSGAGYVFTRKGTVWSEQQKLTASDGVKRDEFCSSVSIDGNKIVIGSALDDDNGFNSGSFYLFMRTGESWNEQAKLLPSDGFSFQGIGNRVAIDGDEIIVGADGDNDNGPSSGAAYFFGDSTAFDFDRDQKSDIAIFRPSVGQWWYLRSSDNADRAFTFGNFSDKPVPADFTGDAVTDIAFWRESTGEWFVLRSEDFSFYSFPFGTIGDIPAPGDFDDDGRADPAVFRPASATWFISRSTDGGTTIESFGVPEDKPVIADYDGDGQDDVAIFRPSVAQWWINRSREGVIAYQFGQTGDRPVPGDYTGDGKADVAFWRPASGEWFVIRSENDSFYAFPFGANGDNPVPGDYDGDGKTDAAVFRPSDNTWYLLRGTGEVQTVNFGTMNDVPLPSVYIP